MTQSSRMRRLGAAALVAALALGCGELPASPTRGTVSAAGIAGTWRVELIQPAGDGAVLTPAGATYTFTFQGGVLAARVDCNACNGRFTVVGDTLTVLSGLACTRAACPTADFEAPLLRIASGASTLRVTGDVMSLTSGRGLVRLIR